MGYKAIPDHTIAQLAERLWRARRERIQIRHLSREFPGMTADDAYDIQRKWVSLEQSDGRIVRGYKVGLTTAALQAALKASGPNYGPLLDDTVFCSGADVPAGRFIAPRVEVEFAFVLGRRLNGFGIRADDVLRATAYVVPAFEIIDARIEQLDRETRNPRTLVDVIADFAAAAGVVMAESRIDPAAVDLSRVTATLYKNDAPVETGAGAAVLGHPANSVAWLANRLASEGKYLEEGETILAGSLTKPITVAVGDRLRADYEALGSVHFQLT
jgi:2-oxo-hept-3-ene-1,7-dioate hydratase